MAHTYCSSLFHCVFSTKGRRKTIAPELQDRLWAYMGGIASVVRQTDGHLSSLKGHGFSRAVNAAE
jgi:hypothetical protein